MYMPLLLNAACWLYLPKILDLSPAHAAVPRDTLSCGLFTLTAQLLKPSPQSLAFLVYTGSCVSILPRFFSESQNLSGALRAANGSSIPTFGTVILSILKQSTHNYNGLS